MKKYTKNWLASFLITALTITCFALAFLLFLDMSLPKQNNESKQNESKEKTENEFPKDYVSYDDNVGGVSFTEDQITELVRNIYSLDGFINNLYVDFEENGELIVQGKIKDVGKLCEIYPELEGYRIVLSAIENKNITVKGRLVNNDGMTDFEIDNASVGGVNIDKAILSPFLEEGTFSELFNVSFDSVEILSDAVVFKEGLPDILSY